MNRKTILILSIIIVVGVGAVMLYLSMGLKSDDNQALAGDAIYQDSLDAIDREIKAHREALLREQNEPADFIEIEIDPHKNLLGESVIEGELHNKATGTRYEDLELMIYWQDETGAVMDSVVEVVFQTIDPGETSTFKTKRKGPRKSKAIQVKLRKAKAIEK